MAGTEETEEEEGEGEMSDDIRTLACMGLSGAACGFMIMGTPELGKLGGVIKWDFVACAAIFALLAIAWRPE